MVNVNPPPWYCYIWYKMISICIFHGIYTYFTQYKFKNSCYCLEDYFMMHCNFLIFKKCFYNVLMSEVSFYNFDLFLELFLQLKYLKGYNITMRLSHTVFSTLSSVFASAYINRVFPDCSIVSQEPAYTMLHPDAPVFICDACFPLSHPWEKPTE